MNSLPMKAASSLLWKDFTILFINKNMYINEYGNGYPLAGNQYDIPEGVTHIIISPTGPIATPAVSVGDKLYGPKDGKISVSPGDNITFLVKGTVVRMLFE